MGIIEDAEAVLAEYQKTQAVVGQRRQEQAVAETGALEAAVPPDVLRALPTEEVPVTGPSFIRGLVGASRRAGFPIQPSQIPGAGAETVEVPVRQRTGAGESAIVGAETRPTYGGGRIPVTRTVPEERRKALFASILKRKEEGATSPPGKIIQDIARAKAEGASPEHLAALEAALTREGRGTRTVDEEARVEKLYRGIVADVDRLAAKKTNLRFGGSAMQIAPDGSVLLGAKGSEEALDYFDSLRDPLILDRLKKHPAVLELYGDLHAPIGTSGTAPAAFAEGEAAQAKAQGTPAPSAPGQTFATLPDPALFKGRTITDLTTGELLTSDGTRWVPEGKR